MKRFLSLVLSLVMVMSLVTVSAGAKDFTDNDTIAYDEAVAVVSEVGIVDGYADGTFKPTNTLTRQAAAKIICNLILGPTTAAELHADTAPYPDVPTTSEFAGYIAFCQSRKIISGYSDGNFKPGNTLTGYAFMKMLLGALGYDASLEGYTGGNWSINVAKQALGIGLDDGLEVRDEAVFNGLKAVTREEACLYAFNTLQADLVEYGQRLTTNINGTEVTLSSGGAQSRKWNSQQSRYENIRNDNIIQFAEEYFNKLVKRDDTDKFERPANTWLYDKVEIGTWTDFTLLVERYTTAITGKDVYDLLGATAIDDNKLLVALDGASNYGESGLKDNKIGKIDLVRTNKNDLPGTGNGVLTEIFLDTDTDELTISSIHTYLAQATDNYNEAKEYAPLEVWGNFDYNATGDDSRIYNVDVEDVKNVVDVEDEEFYLVNISYKDNDNGEVVILNDVEILEDNTVSKFSAGSQGDGTSRVTKLTTGGTEYKNNYQAWYDEDILDTYNDQLLTDNTYNVFLDQYGYFIGVSLFEGTKNYVFITGFDRGSSNIAVKTADATGIFLDGTMDTFKVNVTDTDKNIENMKVEENSAYFHKWNDPAAWRTDAAHPYQYEGGVYNVNQWYTYTENNGTYTLKPCARMTWTKYNAVPGADQVTLKTDKLDVKDTEGSGQRVYGEDDTQFITVELDNVDTTYGSKKAIAEVSGVYTGAQNVSIEIDQKDTWAVQEGQVYTVYDKNYFVIGAVVIGEGNGANANYAYVIEGPKSEEKIDDTYYWEFDAVVGGEIKTLTAKSKYSNTINPVIREQTAGVGTPYDRLVELRFDGDYVVNIKDVTDVYGLGVGGSSPVSAQIKDEDFYDVTSHSTQFDAIGATAEDGTFKTNVLDLNLKGRSLYVTGSQKDVGLALTTDCKAVVIQDENGKSNVKTEFTSVKSAIARLAEPTGFANVNGTQYEGRIVAALNSDGAATWVVFLNDNELKTGTQPGGGGQGDENRGVKAENVGVVGRNGNISFTLTLKDGDQPAYIPSNATATVDYSVYVNGLFITSGTGLTSASVPVGGQARVNGSVNGDLYNAADEGDSIEVEINKVTFDRVKVLYVTNAADTTNTVALQTAPATAHTTWLAVGGSGVTMNYEIADSYDLTAAIANTNITVDNITHDNALTTDASAIAANTGVATIATARATDDEDYARVIIAPAALSARDWQVTGFAAAAGTALDTATWAPGSDTYAADDALQVSVLHDAGGTDTAVATGAADGTNVKWTVALSGAMSAGAYRVQIAKLGFDKTFNAAQVAPAANEKHSDSVVVKVDKDITITPADVKITTIVAPVTIAANAATWDANSVTINLTGTAITAGSFLTSASINSGIDENNATVELSSNGKQIKISFTGGQLVETDSLTVDMTEILAAYDLASADTWDTITLDPAGVCVLSHT